MCRRINIFIPILFISYVVMSMLIGTIIGVTGINLPLWVNYILGEVLIVLPAVVYVILFKINIIKCMPYRKLKVTDGVLSLLIGYALIPLILFVSNLTTLFSTNYLQDSMSELTSYPFLVQLFLIAVVPAVVEEFVFRGLIYHSYRKNGILGAAVLSAVVFGFMHLNINQLSYALIMGVVFALMVEVTGSMYSAMLAH
ncbi:MAG: CPBP family intramembrane metalloprotease, partial [Lachnospira sp.]|nr:CPBP family intramembrane metalloprotease [Lachnospira sp.]